MQTQILLFFHRVATASLDALAEFITMFAETGAVLVIGVVIFWCVDKRKGFAIFSTLLFALIGANVIKALVRMPRPFTVISEISGKRVETATGYSFPSGHTTTAASAYASIALAFRKRWLSITSALLILLVGISRMYLGVHWPVDVAAGLILGTMTSFLLYGRMYAMEPPRKESFSLVFGIVTASLAMALAILLSASVLPSILVGDLMKTLSLSGGCFLGSFLEGKYVRFSSSGTAGRKAVRFLLGLAGLLLIMALKTLFPESFSFPGAFIRYGLLGLWVTWLYPLLGCKLNLFAVD